MRSDKNMETQSPDKIWIISKGGYTDQDMNSSIGEEIAGPVKEYRISELSMRTLISNPLMYSYILRSSEESI